MVVLWRRRPNPCTGGVVSAAVGARPTAAVMPALLGVFVCFVLRLSLFPFCETGLPLVVYGGVVWNMKWVVLYPVDGIEIARKWLASIDLEISSFFLEPPWNTRNSRRDCCATPGSCLSGVLPDGVFDGVSLGRATGCR